MLPDHVSLVLPMYATFSPLSCCWLMLSSLCTALHFTHLTLRRHILLLYHPLLHMSHIFPIGTVLISLIGLGVTLLFVTILPQYYINLSNYFIYLDHHLHCSLAA